MFDNIMALINTYKYYFIFTFILVRRDGDYRSSVGNNKHNASFDRLSRPYHDI